MPKLRSAIALVVVGASLISTPVFAATVSECKDLIDVVRSTLDGAEIGGRNPERTRAGLESKLDGAKIKLDQGKFCDAHQKLLDFRAKIEDLAVPNLKGEVKIAAEDAADLIAAVDDAIVCVLELDPDCAAP